MSDGLSLIEEVRKGRYEVSIVTTYNVYFPFYEGVLLGHLTASGCRHNVLAVDAGQCGAALANASTRPRAAGRAYSLLPLKAGGAFHPKLVLLVGRERAVLLVGSHNVTLSGFSHNRELTNRFEAEVKGDPASLSAVRGAWSFVAEWSRALPEELRASLEEVRRFAPWLEELSEPAGDSPLVVSSPDEGSLWEKVKGRLPRKVRRVIVTGPYFDRDLRFLKLLQEELSPKEMIVGLDPRSAVITERATKVLPEVRFVSADCLNEGKGFLHAKALLFEGGDGTELLVTGSANPSSPAWTSRPAGRNAEAVVVRASTLGESLGEALGLKELADEPPLGDEAWLEIKRHALLSSEKATAGRSPLFALEAEGGFEIDASALTENLRPEVNVLDSGSRTVGSGLATVLPDGLVHVRVQDAGARDAAALLECLAGEGEPVLAIVHRSSELSELSKTDRQREIGDVIASLGTASPMLEELMRIAEKVIFDELPETPLPAPAVGGKRSGVPAGAGAQSSYVIDLADTKRTKRRKSNLVSSGDLGVLLDALIYRLGVGLDAERQRGPAPEKSEEELVGSEEEELLPITRGESEARLRAHHRKVKILLRRMVRQIEAAARDQSRALRAVTQLAAVLGLTHRLCEITSDEVPWLPKRETLVPWDARAELFLNASRLLYSRENRVMASALAQLSGAACLEVSVVRGFLIWLAWNCDYGVEDLFDQEDPEYGEDMLGGLARLVLMAPDVANDDDAFERATAATKGVWRQYFAEEFDAGWLENFREWASAVEKISHDPRTATPATGRPDVGDIVYPTKAADPQLFVVHEVEGKRVRLLDLDADEESKPFSADYVTVVMTASRD